MARVTTLAVVACHDRVVSREFLVEVLQLCGAMSEVAARADRASILHHAVCNLDKRHLLHDDEKKVQMLVQPEVPTLPKMLYRQFQEAFAELTKLRRGLAAKIELLTECRDFMDPVS